MRFHTPICHGEGAFDGEGGQSKHVPSAMTGRVGGGGREPEVGKQGSLMLPTSREDEAAITLRLKLLRCLGVLPRKRKAVKATRLSRSARRALR